MQNFSQTPIFSDVADWFAYPAFANGQNKNIQPTQAFGTAKGYITFQPDHYFLCTGFAAKTNYDNFGGVFASADATARLLIPQVPNAFLLTMERGSQNSYSNIELTQAEVCSSGSLSGKQSPFPVIYGPAVTVSFLFQDLTGFARLTEANAAVPLVLQFWMLGYSIPQSFDGRDDSNFHRFLEYFPDLRREYLGS